MTWREQTIVRILLIIARMLADAPELQAELRKLATHIAVNAPKGTEADA